MWCALELPRADNERLEAAQVCQDQRLLAEDECEGEGHGVEEWKQLDGQVLLAGCSSIRISLERVDCVWFLSVNDIDLGLAPDACDELFVVELEDAPRVTAVEVPLLRKVEVVRVVVSIKH